MINSKFPNTANFMKWECGDTSAVGQNIRKLDLLARATLTWVQEHLLQGAFSHEDYQELCELNISVEERCVIFTFWNCFA